MKIALIGAGPRNLMELERLVYWSLDQQIQTPIKILVFDPFGIGGRVWNPNQNHELKMNSLASKITLFTDDSIQMRGRVHYGPTLFEWATSLGTDFVKQHQFDHQNLLLNELAEFNKYSYSSRALFGIYQIWYFEHILKRLPDNIEVQVYQEQIVDVHREDHQYIVISDEAAHKVDVISAALGEGTNFLSQSEVHNEKFARENRLKYIPIAYPAEVDVDDILPNDRVIIRGLGLSFIDYLSELTERRGGIFERDEAGLLNYTRSGDEPTIYAGSRRGLPYHARGLDQKKVGETFRRYFLSDAYVEGLIKNRQLISGEEFIKRIKSDVALTYYVKLAASSYDNVDPNELEKALAQNLGSFKKVLDSFNIATKDRINWKQWQNPIPSDVVDTASFTDFVKSYLQQDLDIANEGNLTAPFTSALEKLRELRTNIRKVVTHQLLSSDDYVKYVIEDFNSFNSFLAVGPPAFRIEQILALIKAGVLKLIGPGMVVEDGVKEFITYSTALSDHKKYEGNVLIEGRLPQPDAIHTKNPLLENLIVHGWARPYTLELKNGETYQTGAVDVTMDTAEMINADGKTVKNFFVWGLPTEKKHWLTNGAPIPGVNDVRLRMADLIASQIIQQIQNSNN